jgi:hypothetical protein
MDSVDTKIKESQKLMFEHAISKPSTEIQERLHALGDMVKERRFT